MEIIKTCSRGFTVGTGAAVLFTATLTDLQREDRTVGHQITLNGFRDNDLTVEDKYCNNAGILRMSQMNCKQQESFVENKQKQDKSADMDT